MSLLRQSRWFVLVGAMQWIVDWSAMVLLSHAGVDVVRANIAARVCGAMLGFWLNGSITFAREDAPSRWRQALRYIVLWCVCAAISTTGVATVAGMFGLGWAWLAKPLVDGLIAIGSFLVSRHWVYR